MWVETDSKVRRDGHVMSVSLGLLCFRLLCLQGPPRLPRPYTWEIMDQKRRAPHGPSLCPLTCGCHCLCGCFGQGAGVFVQFIFVSPVSRTGPDPEEASGKALWRNRTDCPDILESRFLYICIARAVGGWTGEAQRGSRHGRCLTLGWLYPLAASDSHPGWWCRWCWDQSDPSRSEILGDSGICLHLPAWLEPWERFGQESNPAEEPVKSLVPPEPKPTSVYLMAVLGFILGLGVHRPGSAETLRREGMGALRGRAGDRPPTPPAGRCLCPRQLWGTGPRLHL